MSMDHERKSASDVRRDRALLRDALPAVLALLLIQIGAAFAAAASAASGWSSMWWLLPLLPVAWLGWAQWRSLRRCDELQRLQQLTAMACGFAAMLMLSLAGSLLAAAGVGNQAQWLQVTFIGGLLAWLGALAVAARRAR